jgi:hypothetical protein
VDVTKCKAQNLLSNVPEHHVFKCCDGRLIRSIRDLGKTLAHMNEEAFRYHANHNKNDFSNWVHDIIGDEKLANDLKKADSKNKTLKELSRRITFLSGQLAQ